MARTAGAFSVLVLTGTTHEQDLGGVSAAHQPDLVVRVVGDLLGQF